MRPEVGSISRLIWRTMVDLPEPDSPITQKISPRGTSSEQSASPTTHPNLLERLRFGETLLRDGLHRFLDAGAEDFPDVLQFDDRLTQYSSPCGAGTRSNLCRTSR